MLTFFVPRMSSVAVGKEMTGPAPQMTLPTFAGEKNNEVCTSPSPVVPFTPGARSGTWITGNNSPSNQIPVIRQLEGDNRFELQDVAVFFFDPCVRVRNHSRAALRLRSQ